MESDKLRVFDSQSSASLLPRADRPSGGAEVVNSLHRPGQSQRGFRLDTEMIGNRRDRVALFQDGAQ